VKLLSGTIEVRSEVGAGSTFTLVVPRTLADPGISTGIEVDGQLAADTAARVDAALLDRTGIEDDRDDLTESAPLLLIVEDDPGFAQTLVHVGRDEGFKCVVALRGDTGVALAHQLQPSAILLDVGLPVIDGLTVVDRLKRHPATAAIPIHVLSGAEAPALLREACASFVEKPIDDATLRELLASIAASSPPRPGRVDAAEQVPGEISFAGRRALIVDDDVRNVFALASALEAHGMEIAYAENGAEAIRTLESDPIDIALMDVMMPEMDGYQTMRTIRSMPQLAGLPIIAVTAKAMRGDRERSIAAGASDYITKPVDTDVLLSLLDIWLYDPARVAVATSVEASAA
jgi:CheY-like chemotaxis protein